MLTTSTNPAVALTSNAAAPIDEIISRLRSIIDHSITQNTRIGYFAALYYKVTVRVKEAISNKEFDDNGRMERFVVLFANRYLAAVDASANKQPMSQSWQVTFDALKKPGPLVIQHLLLGMNAHINLDLGIAAASITSDDNIQTIRKDFNSINDILGSMVFEVINQLNKVSPLLSLFGLHAGNDSTLIQFSISNARDGAWVFAEDLHSKKGEAFTTCITERDNTIKRIGLSLITSKGFLIKVTKFIIWLFEWKRPSRITGVLFQYEKKYLTVTGDKVMVDTTHKKQYANA